MNTGPKSLQTRKGRIPFPAYIPVTTFGGRYPLDRLVQPYLPRLAPAVMVSAYYARQIERPLRIPMLVDSGGFAALFERATVVRSGSIGLIEIQRDDTVERIEPLEVLDLQERLADVAFTLDFPIPPGLDADQAKLRFELTLKNAVWALENRRRKDLPLYACIQSWDRASARAAAKELSTLPFDGFAIGGLVPRARNTELVFGIATAVREEIGDRPLHVFGLGKPELVRELFNLGVDSVDSSSYVRLAAAGRLWADASLKLEDPSPTDRLHLALLNLALACQTPLPLSLTRLSFGERSVLQGMSLEGQSEEYPLPDSEEIEVREPSPIYGAPAPKPLSMPLC